MDNKLSSVVSCTLATLAGICFIGGLVILTGEGENIHEQNRGSSSNVGVLIEHK